MKHIVVFCGIVVLSVSAWAAPERMEMYATLSAPIASFGEIQTVGSEPVKMPSDSELNLGFASDTTNATASGKVDLQGKKPLRITNLYMEKGTALVVGQDENNKAKWMVTTLYLAPTGKATFNGALIVDTLAIDPDVSTITIQIDDNLRLLKTVSAQDGVFNTINTNDGNTPCSSGGFCFNNGTSGPVSATWRRVECSINEKSTTGCSPGKWLVGG